ncbi:MAG: bifunctional precorrin-2 dehydrogenase/sirohydrochlorin ferrochelatase [Cyclobacteriaceae bacterium]|nr:bifunctional precorrin-2 dehydrogenase/sirohydrochlorin ferrochelatase [Cyclobacteriaceae bacterium]
MEQNTLYPIFLKLDQITTLIIGGGKAASEKLTFMLKNSPNANVRLVSPVLNKGIEELVANRPDIELIRDEYQTTHLNGVGLVIAATDSREVNHRIYTEAKAHNILVNTADTPELCQFYLGGIVTKGNLKIGISTNGKAPVLAKRLREFFEQSLPDSLNDLISNLDHIRKKLHPDLATRTAALNSLTKDLAKQP